MSGRAVGRAGAFAAVVVGMLSGCASGDEGAEPRSVASSTGASASPGPTRPTTAAGVLDAARESMAAEPGWTFAVKGEESLVFGDGTSGASYTSTVRLTGEPEAFHSTGTVVSKGTSRAEEVFVVDGVGHVREGGAGARWTSGPVSEPDIANKVEDPLAALDAFAAYTEGGEKIEVAEAGGEITLSLRLPHGRLSDDGPALAKAVREVRPTVDQLREAGVTATDDEIVLRRLDDVLVLDATTFRIKSHRFSFGFLIPHQGRQISYGQEVAEHNRGTYAGTIELPADAG